MIIRYHMVVAIEPKAFGLTEKEALLYNVPWRFKPWMTQRMTPKWVSWKGSANHLNHQIYLQNPQVTFFSPHANGQEFLFNSFRLDILMQNWPFGVCQWNFERGLDQPLVHASPSPPPSFQHWLNFFKRGWSETSNRGEVAMFKSQNASVSFSTMFSS